MNPETDATVDPSNVDYWGGAGEFLHSLENGFTQIATAAVQTATASAVEKLQSNGKAPATVTTEEPAAGGWPFTPQQTILGALGIALVALLITRNT
jgi:uncharacterized protein GlcG (DUF336 family)